MTVDLGVDILSGALIVAGSFFVIVGGIGLIRMPDVYTRTHAASLIDSLGSALLIFGLILQAGPTLIALKLVFLYVLIFFTTPVATHALAQAAMSDGIEPILSYDGRGKQRPGSVPEAKDADRQSEIMQGG